eukprot:58667-Pleurochrysis_carterae.AAC.3
MCIRDRTGRECGGEVPKRITVGTHENHGIDAKERGRVMLAGTEDAQWRMRHSKSGEQRRHVSTAFLLR